MKALRSLALPAWLVALGVCSCHLRPGNGDTVNGVVGDVPFTARDAYAIESTSISSGVPIASVVVAVTDFADACASGSGLHAGSTTVEVAITRRSAPVLAGPYGTDAGGDVRVSAVLQRTDAHCQVRDIEVATAGSVTLDSVTTTDVVGSFALTFADGSLSGGFHATVCGADDAAQVGGYDTGAPLDAGGDAALSNGCTL